MNWSPLQSDALRTVGRWMRDPDSQVYRLFGSAGTGKSTLAQHLIRSARRKWIFGAFTGKAAYVMRQKGCEDARTLHSLIYRPAGETWESEISKLEEKVLVIAAEIAEASKPEPPAIVVSPEREDQIKLLKLKLDLTQDQLSTLRQKSKSRFELWANSPLADADVEGIVVDEVSMVDEQLGRDLESFGKKILVLGDPYQLPPVGGGGYFTNREPDTMLTEVHRQALDSGVLRLATWIREGKSVEHFYGEQSDDAVILFRADYADEDGKREMAKFAMEANQVLVGRNDTRTGANHRHRQLLGRTTVTPTPGDRLVCLRNDRKLGLYNGSQWVVEEASASKHDMTGWVRVRSEDDERAVVECETWLHWYYGKGNELKQMGPSRRDMSEFDYSYALTVHKAQGSQWSKVLVIDESRSFSSDRRRWLYTAVTRAADKVTVLT